MNNDDATQVTEPVTDEGQVLTGNDATAESSTAMGENPEKKQDGVQARINKLTAEKYQERRKSEELQRELDQIKAKEAQYPAPRSDLQAPVLPDDPYDTEAMTKYHNDMTSYSVEVAKSASNAVYEDRQKQEKENAKKNKLQQTVSRYADNAINDGVDLEELRNAEQVLGSAGISAELGNHLLNDPHGGKIVAHLAANPALMHEVLSLDPMSAAIKIENEVKSQALSTTPKVTGAPEPLPEISGGGQPEYDEFSKQFPDAEFI